ncbi:uncharacterized protein DSM5745_08261 [Aspergillus mulundensis]|uniref:Uncharacterized protein n=1 Tax=Aspergillus mulundensis TaxID=1810919 RepID=A0A3D8R9W8_9EURO|nr:hypothetical protein DSM5745_08261 [Aspergillus mulundensis]RDW70750.1 hypothetical protein DSM5745_08261 [Aspergillus mulundensis]
MPIKWSADMDKLLLVKIIETHDLKVDAKRVADAWPGTTEGQDKPTPRAITERLVRIRADIKAAKGEGTLSIGTVPKSSPGTATPRKARKPATPTSTPDSSKRRRTASTITKSSPLKHEMDIDGADATLADADHELDHDFGTGQLSNNTFSTPTKIGKGRGLFDIPAHPGTPASPTLTPTGLSPGQTLDALAVRAGSSLGLNMKQEDGVVGDGSPVKRTPRARRAASSFNMVNYSENFGDDDDDVDGSASASDYTPDGAVFEDDDFA